ncbi:MAG: NADH-quinone oxidoreductase subunit C [Candidatus Omnitrophica bacterium]|nr:NADH-quinone oxidoreductase subunit C [Candidatus Omnitrophota bacterium]
MTPEIERLKQQFGKSVYGERAETGRLTSVSVAPEVLPAAAEFMARVLEMRFLFLAGFDERKSGGGFRLRYAFAHPREDRFLALAVQAGETEASFPSVVSLYPQANWQEREIQDLFGLKPSGHPDPRRLVLHEDWPAGQYPLRKDFPNGVKVPRRQGDYPFERVEGAGVFEIPVGPVHAGVIEPGHFRFSSAGESILKLEIRLFYTHKGIEKLGEGKSPREILCLAERVSGDNSVSHAAACAQALEALSGTTVPERALRLRVILLELERLYNHVADISGVVLDVAFSFGAAQLAAVKERLLRLNERLTGQRLLRSMIVPGGVHKDFAAGALDHLLRETEAIKKDFEQIVHIIWNSSSFLDRVEETGIIRREIAEALGGTGPAARASGVDRDLRRDHPYGVYSQLFFMVPVFAEGDVESRLKVRIQEIYESFKLIHEVAAGLAPGPCLAVPRPLAPMAHALGGVESPRGECFHWLSTDREGKISRWKIQSPSFANWPLIEYAVLENIVPDFPVINKSLNLSYSGNDR